MREGLTESDAVKYLNDINYKACVGKVCKLKLSGDFKILKYNGARDIEIQGETYMVLVEIPNLKQYYYNVIKELHNIRRDDISTTEHFYYDVQDCYHRKLEVSKCIDELIELQGEKHE